MPRKMVAATNTGLAQGFPEITAMDPSHAVNRRSVTVGCICSTKHSVIGFRIVAAIASHGA